MIEIPPFDSTRFILEAIFTLIIIVLCFFIFFKTREMYNLTKHKGIGFFRMAFLLFGVAYIFRFVFAISHLIIEPQPIHSGPPPLMFLLMIPVGFLGSISLVFLLYSSIWKEYKKHTALIIAVAIILSIITSLAAFFFRSKEIMILFQAMIFLIILSINMKSYFKEKKISKLFYIYVLLFIFWIVNLFVIGNKGRMFDIELMIITEVISIIIFGIIYYKVSKWVK